MGLSKQIKEGRRLEDSLSHGGDEDGDLTGEDVLGNHFRWSVLELSLLVSLFGCVVQKIVEGKMRP